MANIVSFGYDISPYIRYKVKVWSDCVMMQQRKTPFCQQGCWRGTFPTYRTGVSQQRGQDKEVNRNK